jgi:hypothetical protein
MDRAASQLANARAEKDGRERLPQLFYDLLHPDLDDLSASLRFIHGGCRSNSIFAKV